MHYHVRREYSVVVKPALVFSSSVVLVFSSSSDTVGTVCLDLTVTDMLFGSWYRDLCQNPELSWGSWYRDLCQNPEFSCMPRSNTTRNQYSFLNMSTLQDLSSTLFVKPLHTRRNHIRLTQRLVIHEV